MASKTVEIFQAEPVRSLLLRAYGGDNLTASEIDNILIDSTLNESRYSVESVPRLFSQGSWVTGVRVDSKEFTVTCNHFGNSNAQTIRDALNSQNPNTRIEVGYIEDGVEVERYTDARITGYSIRKVAYETYETVLTITAYDTY